MASPGRQSEGFPSRRMRAETSRSSAAVSRMSRRPRSHIHQRLTSAFSAGTRRSTRFQRVPAITLQPREQEVHTVLFCSMNQTRERNRKSAEVRAPTGQMSMTFIW